MNNLLYTRHHEEEEENRLKIEEIDDTNIIMIVNMNWYRYIIRILYTTNRIISIKTIDIEQQGYYCYYIYIYIYIHTQPDKPDYCVYKKKYDNHTTTCT